MEVQNQQPMDGLESSGTTESPKQFPLHPVPERELLVAVMDGSDWWNPLNNQGSPLSPMF